MVDLQSQFGSKSFEQYLCRSRPSAEPRGRCRIVKHAIQIIVLLRIKAPGRAIPMFGQVVDLSVQKKIDSRLIPESVFPAPTIQKINSGFEEMLSPEFVEIHQHYTAVQVSAFRRKIHRLCQYEGVLRE